MRFLRLRPLQAPPPASVFLDFCFLSSRAHLQSRTSRHQCFPCHGIWGFRSKLIMRVPRPCPEMEDSFPNPTCEHHVQVGGGAAPPNPPAFPSRASLPQSMCEAFFG